LKTTLEIPDKTFRRAKSLAAANGLTLREFVTEALEEKLRAATTPVPGAEPEWLRLVGAFGKTASDRRETRRIQELIDREFEVLDCEDKE
jgi:hypothetical protein